MSRVGYYSEVYHNVNLASSKPATPATRDFVSIATTGDNLIIAEVELLRCLSR